MASLSTRPKIKTKTKLVMTTSSVVISLLRLETMKTTSKAMSSSKTKIKRKLLKKVIANKWMKTKTWIWRLASKMKWMECQ